METKNKSYKLMAEILKEINPIAYQACINLFKPILTDLTLLPYVYRKIGERYEHNMENRIIALSIIYRLYAPEKLFLTSQKTEIGIRSAISDVMGFNSKEMVNEYQKKLVVYYKGYRFKAKVDSLAREISTNITHQRIL